MFYSNFFEIIELFKYFSHCGKDDNRFNCANKAYFCGVCNFLKELKKLKELFNYFNEKDLKEYYALLDQLDKVIYSFNDIKKHLNNKRKELINNLDYLRG